MLKSSACLVLVGLLGAPLAPLRAQTPVPAPPSLPTGPTAPASAGVPAPAAAGSVSEIVGRTYSVELLSGNTFVGVLRSSGAQELEFQTQDLGVVRVQRVNLKQLVLLSAEQATRGYDDVGNGNRLFFAPTARNLRKGEGYVQNLELFLLSVNYGVTDNFSIGALASIIPGAGSYNFVGLTPKVSFPVAEKFRLGAGGLLLFNREGAYGITYANGTYGSADNNLTLGVGYAYSGTDGFYSTPVFVLGGATRVSRRISLMNETYLVRSSDSYGTATAVLGIAGLRYATSRIGGGLGLAYVYGSYQDNGNSSTRFGYDNGTAYPFGEVTVRFGRIK
ncbi:hypothetical protein MUN81_02920 [Hymenobacter sp. 5317J-9]|uniref:hypothetical protein n=1 Tax=Hymenobacter sp. 5317J-9 TaxID=2932250 RepID=UPI001FD66F9B|nr:hypothetical protein [Hymenobacter sp. 5317J-9]UOQ98447.1 hypothetical protein MUN81_02920 [Hymenobacter sp. 5317J-9]